mgnify:CR=1 FL=1
MKNNLLLFLLFVSTTIFSQTKVSGIVIDESGLPVAFANIIFKGSSEGTISNDDGVFYMESDATYDTVVVSFIGYDSKEIVLDKKVNYQMSIVLTEGGEQLKEVVVYSGKQSKKNNPAIDILRKIWEMKRQNGVKHFKQYNFEKYLPIFLNETFSKVYGDNTISQEKEEILGTKNSGFSNNQALTAFVEDLYSDYDIYNNYLKFFDKSFTSPLSKTGIDVYNYVLSDSTFIDNKWCYNIIYYPRRKNELTFKGNFWVNDSTYAIKKINLEVTKSANINWVKEIYIEQDFEVMNDSVFLLKRDYMLSDFSLNKKEQSKGIYGKRTTVYNNYVFDEHKNEKFYKNLAGQFDSGVVERDSIFWKNNRLEELNKDEKGVYKLLDTLKTVPKFKSYYNIVSILGSGYVEIDKWNLDLGDVYSTFGFNDAEGIRVRAGARTYFGQNDPWRIEAYTAYGFSDHKFKHGISGKWLLDKKSRLIISGGNRRDIEQLGLSLTSTTDVLGRSAASSSLFSVGSNDRLTNIDLSTINVEVEPLHNFRIKFGGSLRTLSSALPDAFSLDYIDASSSTGIASEIKQFDVTTTLIYTPGKRTIGYGVERRNINDTYSTLFLNYTKGIEGFLESDFDYEKLQFSYTQPWQIGGFGKLYSTVEIGKTFGEVPLGLLNVIPGNQTLFSIYGTFPNLNFYEFVTDTYASVHLEQNFNGRLFSKIPLLKKWNLREIVGLRGVWGDLSDENVFLNSPTNIPLIAPNDKIYWEYSFGVGNIFKIFRIDFNFRGNYLESPEARPFSVSGSFGFSF